MSYGANGRWFKGGGHVTASSFLRGSVMKPRRKSTKKPPPAPLPVIAKDLQRPAGHRRAQRQRNKVAPIDRDREAGGTSTTDASAAADAVQCLFCLPETRASVSAFPASLRKGSQVAERNRSPMTSGGKGAGAGAGPALHPQNLPRYTPNEVVLNWKAYSQTSAPSSSSYRPRMEVTPASSSPLPPSTQNSTTYVPSTTTTPTNTPTLTTTTTAHQDVFFPRSFNSSYIATLLPGPFLDRSLFPSSSPSAPPAGYTTHAPAAGVLPEEQLVSAAAADQGLSSPVVIGLAVGCVLAFWLVIGPIVCVVMKRSLRTSQTKLFQRQECRTGSGKRTQGSSRLLEEMEISALEKARLYHRTEEYPDDGHVAGRFPVVYAPVPQAPPSPPHHARDFCPPGYDPGYMSTANDVAMERNSSESSTRTYETLSVDGTAIGFCVCGRERICLSSSVQTPVIGCPVMQNGRWHPLTKNTDFDGWYPEETYCPNQQLPVAVACHAKADPATTDDPQPNFPTIGSAGTSRKFPKMGQTCLRNSYASRGRSRTHGLTQDGLADWSTTEDCGRPRPEGRARSEDRVDDEVLINRCVRTPVGYRRLARAGSVSPRGLKARKLTSLDPTCIA